MRGVTGDAGGRERPLDQGHGRGEGEKLVREARDSMKQLYGPGEFSGDPHGVVLIGLVRDGLPVRPFLDYHLALGVRHAVLLQEGSGDEATPVAKGYDDVTVLSTALSFETHGQAARRYLTERFGAGGWVLCLEADERFDYPYSEIISLDSLIEYLNRKSYTALAAHRPDPSPDAPSAALGRPEMALEAPRDFQDPAQERREARTHPVSIPLAFAGGRPWSTDGSARFSWSGAADLTGAILGYGTDGEPGEPGSINGLVDRGLLGVSESYMTWVDRRERQSPPWEALRERPYRLAEAFCRDRARREARTDSVRRLESQVEELERVVAEERSKAEGLEREGRHLQGQLEGIRGSRVWKALGALTSLKKRLSGDEATPAEEAGSQAPAHDTPGGRAADVNRGPERSNFWIRRFRDRMYVLGFVERTIEELEAFVTNDSRPGMQRLAARELCLWYGDRYSRESARRCLELLPAAREGEGHPGHLRQAAIIEAESRDALSDTEGARLTISRALASPGPHTDLFLAGANLEVSAEARVEWVNRALRLHGISELSCDASSRDPLLDSLKVRETAGLREERAAEAKVSVIIPVYNAEPVLRTALGSVLAQRWDNLEVLVVDDSSADDTASIAEEYAERDGRVRLIRAEANRGAYVARNIALREATGEFVTCHDSDDWSHPEKIERQVEHLLGNPQVVANTSEQARATPDLGFYHRGKIHFLLSNGSSLMFRREPVMERVGFWDSVRFGGDGEFKRRLRKVFGKDSIVDLPTGPLSITRQSGVSLTENEDSGVSLPMGARSEYREVYTQFHETAENLRYEFPQAERAFVVPEPMWPVRETRKDGRRHFDVILASDFRLPGGTTSSNVEEIKAHKRMGLRTGLVQMARYNSLPGTLINPKIRQLLDGDLVQRVVYGEKVSCDTLIVRHPPVLQEFQQAVPDVEASEVQVIVNQTPMRDYSQEGKLAYDIGRCEEHLQRHFGRLAVWHPIGPLVREALHRHHEEELPQVTLAAEDWSNIIDVSEWRRESRPPRGERPRIGRHSRDSYLKWPSDPAELLAAYPGSGGYEVHVLGGAEAPSELLGGLPDNWRVLEFGEVHPRDFLATLDVFVYYTHPDLVEAFGRTIIEAMAVGVPAILPHGYREAFGEAAIYAEPREVTDIVDRLMCDEALYESQVDTASNYVEEYFGYTKHAERLGRKIR